MDINKCGLGMLALVLDAWGRESLGVVRGRKQSVTLGTFCLIYALDQAPGLHSTRDPSFGWPPFLFRWPL